MVHEGSTDWLHAIPMMELAINNSIQDSTGLSPAHIVYGTPIRMPVDMLDGVQGGTYWHLGGLRDAGDPGAGAQAPAAGLEGLEAPSRQTPQGCGVCHRPEGSFEHQEPQVEASKEAPGPVYGTLRGVEASGTNCLQVGSLPQLCLEDDTSSFPCQPSQGF